jgi:hypothetical protein
MNAPRKILDQRIGNHPSETWLREINDMERADEPTYVYQGGAAAATPPLAPLPLTLIPTTTDQLDADDCDSSVCVYRQFAVEVRRVHELAQAVAE